MAKKKHYPDKALIKEDRSATANLPQDVKIIKLPRFGYGLDEGLNDGMSGIDYQVEMDDRKMRKGLQPEKA